MDGPFQNYVPMDRSEDLDTEERIELWIQEEHDYNDYMVAEHDAEESSEDTAPMPGWEYATLGAEDPGYIPIYNDKRDTYPQPMTYVTKDLIERRIIQIF